MDTCLAKYSPDMVRRVYARSKLSYTPTLKSRCDRRVPVSMWRAALAVLLGLALAAPHAIGANAGGYTCCPTCSGKLSSSSATTLLISTVIDSITFEAPSVLSAVRPPSAAFVITIGFCWCPLRLWILRVTAFTHEATSDSSGTLTRKKPWLSVY